MTLQPDVSVNSEHDSKGRFKPGNNGPGNPFARKIVLFRRTMLECISVEDIQNVFKRLVKLAEEGHWQSLKLLLTYLLGKPESLPFSALAYELPDAHEECPPSTNGVFTDAVPSTNGVFTDAAPSTNGVSTDASSSTNGVLQSEPPPAPEVATEIPAAPLTNVEFAPQLSRKQRRALRKAKKFATNKGNAPASGLPPAPSELSLVS